MLHADVMLAVFAAKHPRVPKTGETLKLSSTEVMVASRALIQKWPSPTDCKARHVHNAQELKLSALLAQHTLATCMVMLESHEAQKWKTV